MALTQQGDAIRQCSPIEPLSCQSLDFEGHWLWHLAFSFEPGEVGFNVSNGEGPRIRLGNIEEDTLDIGSPYGRTPYAI